MNQMKEIVAHEDIMTKSWFHIHQKVGQEVELIQLEVSLSRISLENVFALSAHQISKILSNQMSNLLDTVPSIPESLGETQQSDQIR